MSDSHAVLAVVCIDVGSPAEGGGFAWSAAGEAPAVDDPAATSPAALVHWIAQRLAAGPVALGLESPLWLPLHEHERAITSARPDLCDPPGRAWSAGAGATTTTLGLAELCWVLNALGGAVEAVRPLSRVADADHGQRGELLVWEAAATRKAKPAAHAAFPGRLSPHAADAGLAAWLFQQLTAGREPRGNVRESEAQAVNLAWVAATWAGVTVQGDGPRAPVVVVEPTVEDRDEWLRRA